MATALEQAGSAATTDAGQTTGATDPGSNQNTANPTGDATQGGTTGQPTTGGEGQGNETGTTGAADSTTTGTGTTEPPAASDWAAIREKAAGSDPKILKRLERYSSIEEALKAGADAQNRLNATKSLVRPDEKATPEEIKAYREANGVPDSVDGYKIELPDGIVLGDQDKPAAEAFLKVAHDNHIPPKVANAIIAQQLQLQQEAYNAQAQADETARVEGSQALKEAWGSESAANVNLITAMLDEAPQGVKDNMLGARLADGTLLANNPDVLKFLASTARALNPLATFGSVPGTTTMTDIDTRIAELSKMSGDRSSDYWKGPKAALLQKELLDLNERKRLLSAKK